MFEEACASIKINGMTEDTMKLRLFPWSLKDNAKMWLIKLPSKSIQTWEEMQKKFITKYFPPVKANERRTKLMTFREELDELFHEMWERFKDLEDGCPNHGQSQDMLMNLFYQGLTSETRRKVDNASGGDFIDLLAENAYEVQRFHVNARKKGNAAETYQKDDSSAKFRKAMENRRKRRKRG